MQINFDDRLSSQCCRKRRKKLCKELRTIIESNSIRLARKGKIWKTTIWHHNGKWYCLFWVPCEGSLSSFQKIFEKRRSGNYRNSRPEKLCIAFSEGDIERCLWFLKARIDRSKIQRASLIRLIKKL